MPNVKYVRHENIIRDGEHGRQSLEKVTSLRDKEKSRFFYKKQVNKNHYTTSRKI